MPCSTAIATIWADQRVAFSAASNAPVSAARATNEALAKSLRGLADAGKEKTCRAIAELIELGLKEKLSEAEKDKSKGLNSQLEKALKNTLTEALGGSVDQLLGSDAADIAVFGRMVASHPNLTVEAAAMFSHAISTHHAEPEPDFYTAVDDRAKEQDETGADMMGQLEFVSATYYRYIAVNLDLLFYQKRNGLPPANLACFAGEDHRKTRQDIIRAFTEAVLLAVPSGRQTTMNSHTGVAYALGIVREGQPLQLVNAFETPVNECKRETGLLGPSVSRLQEFCKKMFDAWEITDAEIACFCPVKNPCWGVWFGRKACLPVAPILPTGTELRKEFDEAWRDRVCAAGLVDKLLKPESFDRCVELDADTPAPPVETSSGLSAHSDSWNDQPVCFGPQNHDRAFLRRRIVKFKAQPLSENEVVD